MQLTGCMNFNHDICCILWKYKVKSLSIRQQIEDEFLFNSVWISPLTRERGGADWAKTDVLRLSLGVSTGYQSIIQMQTDDRNTILTQHILDTE